MKTAKTIVDKENGIAYCNVIKSNKEHTYLYFVEESKPAFINFYINENNTKEFSYILNVIHDIAKPVAEKTELGIKISVRELFFRINKELLEEVIERKPITPEETWKFID